MLLIPKYEKPATVYSRDSFSRPSSDPFPGTVNIEDQGTVSPFVWRHSKAAKKSQSIVKYFGACDLHILVRTGVNGLIEIAITDLGVSKHMTATQRSGQTNTGTDLWMAPEVRGDKPTYGHPTDVYGFGLTTKFVITWEFPVGKDVEIVAFTQWIDQHCNVSKMPHGKIKI